MLKQLTYPEVIFDNKHCCPPLVLSLIMFACSGEFATYLTCCRGLKFEEKPDYSQLKQLFRILFHKLGYTYDYVFDWNTARLVRNCVSVHLCTCTCIFTYMCFARS